MKRQFCTILLLCICTALVFLIGCQPAPETTVPSTTAPTESIPETTEAPTVVTAPPPVYTEEELIGLWFGISEPVYADEEDWEHTHYADAGYYRFYDNGTFEYTQVKMGKSRIWYHMAGGEVTYEGTYHMEADMMILEYQASVTYAADAEPVRTEMELTEEFSMTANRSCADMCAIIPDHPRLGKLFMFQRAKSDDPIESITISLNSNR